MRDRIRLSIVCKPWSSVSTRPYIPSAPRLPWLLLPQSFPNHLSYFELSEGKIGWLNLPELVQGGWFQGSSKGWMIMIMDKDLDSTIYVSCEPNSRSPAPTSTFEHDAIFPQFCRNNHMETLRKWTILEVLDANEWITDLLFSSGKLYASVISHNKNGVTSGPRNLKFGDHAVELKLVYDKIPRNNDSFEEYDDYLVHLKGTVNSHLVESTTNDEILLVHQVQDKFAKWYDNNHEDDNHEGANGEDNMGGNEDGGEEVNDIGSKLTIVVEDDRDRFYLRTSDFNVYKLHPKKNRIADAKGLGDQLLFLSTAGVLSLPGTDINNL
ncbi:hypothetical protein ACLB2K_040949 [Fragaria x ananassa]